MKKLLLLCGVVLAQAALPAFEATVGTTRLTLPVPAGYALITDEMKPYSTLMKQLVPPSNVDLGILVSEKDAALAAQGKIPIADRNFRVQTYKPTFNKLVTSSEFEDAKRSVKNENERFVKEAEAKMPGLLSKFNRSASKELDMNLDISVGEMFQLPVHFETARALAYSMFMKVNANNEHGTPVASEVAATVSILHVQGKLLYLYAYGEKSDLEWTRIESRKWAEAIVAANPSVGEVATLEGATRRPRSLWDGVAEKAAVGAVVGALVVLVRHFSSKKNRNQAGGH